MGYPSGEPAWQQTELNNLSAAGKLSGINPLVIAGIAGGESGYENAGAGINSSGYGGFFGLGQNSTYSFGGQSFTETPGILSDPSQASFDQQAQAAAAALASYMADTGSLQGGLAKYTGGGPNNIDYQLATQNLGSDSPTLSGTSYPLTGGGGGAPVNSTLDAASGAGAQATTTGLSILGSVVPKGMVARGLLVIVGLILLKVGLDHLLDTNSSPASIIVDSLPSGGGGKGMQGPGATSAGDTSDSASPPAKAEEGGKAAGGEKVAETGAEVAA